MSITQPEWEVQHTSGRCAVTGRALREGEDFYTALLESGESFSRVDYSVEAWTGPPEGAFCFFKTRVAVKEKRKKLLVDHAVLVHFFERLAEETQPVRVQFRFVLALILMRKRMLRYDGSATENGLEVWRMTLMPSKTMHRVINPRLTDEQIEGVSRQLSAILHSDMGEWAGGDDDQSGFGEVSGGEESDVPRGDSPQ
jgi:hypothetical protein